MRRVLRAASGFTLAVSLLGAGAVSAQPAEGEGAVPSGTTGATVRRKPAEGESSVVMPKLVHIERAVYPPAALEQGIEAEVPLKITIDRDGNVSAVEVLEPRGHGFDEAAREAALKFKFEPATRDGEPVPVAIKYNYPFTITVVKPPPDAPPPPPPNTGELAGTLRLSDGDTPLAGVEVVLTLPDGSERRATTDADGRFRLAPAPSGRYRVRVEAPGFRPLASEEDVADGEAVDVVYRVVPEASGLEIVIEGERPSREVTRRTIERREIERIPGTGGDALRSIQSLPGVGRSQPFTAEIIVRGSAPTDTNVFVDGTLAPIIYHFGGLSSVIPTELLERIDFYPGNFSARFGRVGGGIIDVGLREPDTRCYGDYGKIVDGEKGCFHGLLQLDFIDARFLLQGPISENWSFAAAGRRSWFDLWLKPVLEEADASVTSAPVYYDYQAIVERKVGKSRLSLRGFGTDDRLELIVNDPFAQDPGFGGGIRFGTSFYRLQALYQDELSPDVSIESMISWGRDELDFSIGTFLFRLEAHPIYARHEFGFRVADGIKANVGLDFLVSPFEVAIRFPEPPRAGEPDSGPFTTRPVRENQEEGTAFRPAWYGELELQPAARLRVVPGARVDYARDSGHADFSPRLNARYDLVPAASEADRAEGVTRRRTTLKAGIGAFYQPPEFQETDEVFGTPGLESNRFIHYAFGVEQEFTDQVELGVEGFFKDLTNTVSRAPEGSGFSYSNDGEGYVVGLETLLKYKPDQHFFGWVSYTLSRSIRQDHPDDEEYLFQYDQTHNLILLGSYRLGRGWEFGARFRVVSGPLATPVVSPPGLTALYVADAGSYAPLQGAPFSRRLPLFHQLDVRLDKRWQFEDWRFSAYLDIQNVYSNAAVEALTYNYDYSRQQYATGIPIIPSLGLRGEF